ncbi:MAG: hypothetical protein KAG87_15920 [Marinobacter adhaerens]|nr:hypothetical protein [Marinobacter adhaerens]
MTENELFTLIGAVSAAMILAGLLGAIRWFRSPDFEHRLFWSAFPVAAFLPMGLMSGLSWVAAYSMDETASKAPLVVVAVIAVFAGCVLGKIVTSKPAATSRP